MFIFDFYFLKRWFPQLLWIIKKQIEISYKLYDSFKWKLMSSVSMTILRQCYTVLLEMVSTHAKYEPFTRANFRMSSNFKINVSLQYVFFRWHFIRVFFVSSSTYQLEKSWKTGRSFLLIFGDLLHNFWELKRAEDIKKVYLLTR